MYRISTSILLLLMLSSVNSFGQTTAALDSLKEDSLSTATLSALSLLTNKPASYFQVGFGVGNQLYSNNIQALNIAQTDRPFVLTPTVAYFHKSGLSVTANEYLFNDNKTFGANQYSVAPSYETLPGSTWDFLISYTHFFVNNLYSLYSSPIQNDYYSSLIYKKYWIQPGLAFGYSMGASKEVLILDTTIVGQKRHLHDSLTNNLQAYTMALSIQHSFNCGGIFNAEDSLSFIPILMLNIGSSNNNIVNNDNLSTLSPSLTKTQITGVRAILNKKKRRLTKLQNTSFAPQSIAIDLQAEYTIGNFSIQPDVYLNYYLQNSGSQNLTQTFVINFNYSF